MLSAHYQTITRQLFSHPRAFRHGKKPQKEPSAIKTDPLFLKKSSLEEGHHCPLLKTAQSPPWGSEAGGAKRTSSEHRRPRAQGSFAATPLRLHFNISHAPPSERSLSGAKAEVRRSFSWPFLMSEAIRF